MMDDKERFARLCKAFNVDCDDEVMALGYLMRDWLENTLVDADTKVDTGAGIGAFDLWANIGGKSVYINIKTSQ